MEQDSNSRGNNSLMMNVNVKNRPKTGMASVSGSGGSDVRRVKDNNYYLAMIRRHVGEIVSEKERLENEMNRMNSNEKKSKEFELQEKHLEGEVKKYMDQMSTLNLCLDFLSSEDGDQLTEMIKKQSEEMKAQRIKLESEADSILTERKDLENLIESMEEKTKKYEQNFQALLDDSPEEKDTISSLSQKKEQLKKDSSNAKKSFREKEKTLSRMKKEIEKDLSKINYLNRLEEKQELMEHVSKNKEKLDNFKNAHVKLKEKNEKLKEDIKKISYHINLNRDKFKKKNLTVRKKQKKLQEFEKEGGLFKKYQTLKHREKTLMKLIKEIPSEIKSEDRTIEKKQQTIVEVLDFISRDVIQQKQMDIEEDGKSDLVTIDKEQLKDLVSYRDIRDDQEKGLEQNQRTMNRINIEYERKKKILGNMNKANERIKRNLRKVTHDIAQMKSELEVYERLDELRTFYEDLKVKLKDRKKKMTVLRKEQNKYLGKLSRNKETREKSVNFEMESLKSLERKIQNYERANDQILRNVKSKESEMNFSKDKEECLILLNKVNNRLIKNNRPKENE